MVKDLSLISLELPKVNKNLRKFSQQRKTNNSPFKGAPYWDTNKTRVGARMSRWCCPNITHHNIHGNQAKSNTKKNIGHSFKDTEVKICHSKVVPSSKISLSYSQCFNVSRVHPLVWALFPTNPISEVPLAGGLKLFYSNWAKLTQDLNI